MNSIEIKTLTPDENSAWDEFVHNHPEESFYHLSGWKAVIEKSFGHKAIYLYSTKNSKIVGVFPLVHIKSFLFGSFLISLPYLNYGGVLADDNEIENLLLADAIKTAQHLKADFMELRHTEKKELQLLNRQHKISMFLELPNDSEVLWKNLNAKVRNQIRKGEKNNLWIEHGATEKLDDFYAVFSTNMRDLGTPVYSIKFFRNILEQFEASKIFVVYSEEKPIASGMVMGRKERLEIPWASSLREYHHLCGNMFMYWHILKYACESGYSQFDFGRCTPEESTYRFKKQWGAQPVQLNWQYWLANGKPLPEINPDNPKYRTAIKIWQKLPVGVTKLLGPKIVKYIP
jgi:FemAB-related protein (PEP-CTERM system-associated)